MGESLRIAMLGSRGVPASFGGIEHHVEAIGRRLVERGHDVTVFCEAPYIREAFADDGVQHEYLGMRLVPVPTVASKHLEALIHSARSTRRAIAGDFDVIHYHAVGPGVFSFVPRALRRGRVVQTIHGLDAERAKWGLPARTMLRIATWLSARVPHSTIVVSEDLARQYADRYGRAATYIPNGVEPLARVADSTTVLEAHGLERDRYVLFLGRLVPEKCPDLLLRAFAGVAGDEWHLAIAGSASYTDDYVVTLRRLAEADNRAQLVGSVYGEARDALYTNAALFVLPSALEGLPLTLLEAIAAGVPVIASDIPPHVEIIGLSRPGARLFAAGDEAALRRTLEDCLRHLADEQVGAESVRESVLDRYDWERVTDELERHYRQIARPT